MVYGRSICLGLASVLAFSASCGSGQTAQVEEPRDASEDKAEYLYDQPLLLADAMIPLDAPVNIADSGMPDEAKLEFLDCIETRWDGPLLLPWEDGYDFAFDVVISDCAFETGLDEWVPLWVPDNDDSEMLEAFGEVVNMCLDQMGLPSEAYAEIEPGYFDIDWDVVDAVDPDIGDELADCVNESQEYHP